MDITEFLSIESILYSKFWFLLYETRGISI